MREMIQVAVVDDHPIMREGIVHTLEADPDIKIVGQGASAAMAVEIADKQHPDVMLLDINMPGSGLVAATEINERWSDIKVVFLTVSESEQHVRAAFEAEARGYILKGVGGDELKRAVKSIHGGQLYVSPDLLAVLLTTSGRGGVADLTPMESKILERIANGQTNQEIGDALNLTQKTVKVYASKVFRKLGVRNRVEAAVLFNRERTEH
ncbi:MAG: response regulator [Hyphomicrobiaceae bacterium]